MQHLNNISPTCDWPRVRICSGTILTIRSTTSKFPQQIETKRACSIMSLTNIKRTNTKFQSISSNPYKIPLTCAHIQLQVDTYSKPQVEESVNQSRRNQLPGTQSKWPTFLRASKDSVLTIYSRQMIKIINEIEALNYSYSTCL